VLRSTKRFTRTQIADLLDRVLTTRLLRVPETELVEEALRLFRATRADFADTLIGVLNRRAGCTTTYTFDRAAAATTEFTGVV
jgi:predicted nucleic-acid-binding protein